MPEIFAEPPPSSCYRLFPKPGIQESQGLDPDRFLPLARVREGPRKGKLGKPARPQAGILNLHSCTISPRGLLRACEKIGSGPRGGQITRRIPGESRDPSVH